MPDAERVHDPEKLGRALHSGNCDDPNGPDQKSFQLSELLPKAVPDHDCGNSGGISVQRVPPMTEDGVAQQAVTFAAKKAGRTAFGAAFAVAEKLREIRLEQVPHQVVYVIPDGCANDPGHVVIRMDPKVPDGLQKKVRQEIIKAFRAEFVPPPAAAAR